MMFDSALSLVISLDLKLLMISSMWPMHSSSMALRTLSRSHSTEFLRLALGLSLPACPISSRGLVVRLLMSSALGACCLKPRASGVTSKSPSGVAPFSPRVLEDPFPGTADAKRPA